MEGGREGGGIRVTGHRGRGRGRAGKQCGEEGRERQVLSMRVTGQRALPIGGPDAGSKGDEKERGRQHYRSDGRRREAPAIRGTEVQRYRGTEGQRYRGREAESNAEQPDGGRRRPTEAESLPMRWTLAERSAGQMVRWTDGQRQTALQIIWTGYSGFPIRWKGRSAFPTTWTLAD